VRISCCVFDEFCVCLHFDKFFFLVRYASLRRRLLVEPHVPKNGTNSANLVIDNPLSLNPGTSKFFVLYFSTLLGVKSLTKLRIPDSANLVFSMFDIYAANVHFIETFLSCLNQSLIMYSIFSLFLL